MARHKNALRQHLIADFDGGKQVPSDGEFKELARWITSITESSDETVEDYGDYAGDGTPKEEVVSIKEKYDVEGTYDPTDEAQTLIVSKKRKLGDDRKVWHKIISADGQTSVVGLATLSNIVAGSGEATEYEAFSCSIAFDEIAKVVDGADVGVVDGDSVVDADNVVGDLEG